MREFFLHSTTLSLLFHSKISTPSRLLLPRRTCTVFGFFTPWSKDGIRTAAAVIAPNFVKTVRLSDNVSRLIFTMENSCTVQYMALDIISRTRSKNCVVFSDSLSSLLADNSCKVENPLILKILKDHKQLTNSGKSITSCWISSHVGIRGNEYADIAAKAELDVAITNMRFPVSDL